MTWSFIQRVTEDNWRPWHSIQACYYNFTTDAPNQKFYQTSLDTASTGTLQTDMVANKNGINAYGVQLRWRASDLSTAASTFGSGITSAKAATGTGAQSTSGGSPGSSGSSGSSGLSTGAKVGIGIGCAVAGILIILLAIFLFLRSRRRNGSGSVKGSLNGGIGGRSTRPAELQGSGMVPQHEMDSIPSNEKMDYDTKAAIPPHTVSPPQAQKYVELESRAT